MAVATVPGPTPLTVIPYGASSMAMTLVSSSTAPFEAQ